MVPKIGCYCYTLPYCFGEVMEELWAGKAIECPEPHGCSMEDNVESSAEDGGLPYGAVEGFILLNSLSKP